MRDRKVNNILIIAICLVLAVAGGIYEIYSMRDGVSVREFLDVLDMESGAENEAGS